MRQHWNTRIPKFSNLKKKKQCFSAKSDIIPAWRCVPAQYRPPRTTLGWHRVQAHPTDAWCVPLE